MNRNLCAAIMILAATPAPLIAQDVPTTGSTASAPAGAAAPADAAASNPCKPKKKKKGFGLGGILKVARNSGLTSVVGGGLLGQGGAIAGTAANIGAGVADGASKPEPAGNGC